MACEMCFRVLRAVKKYGKDGVDEEGDGRGVGRMEVTERWMPESGGGTLGPGQQRGGGLGSSRSPCSPPPRNITQQQNPSERDGLPLPDPRVPTHLHQLQLLPPGCLVDEPAMASRLRRPAAACPTRGSSSNLRHLTTSSHHGGPTNPSHEVLAMLKINYRKAIDNTGFHGPSSRVYDAIAWPMSPTSEPHLMCHHSSS